MTVGRVPSAGVGATPAPTRVVGIADSDSYVKWTAALLGGVVDADVSLVLLTTPLTVSAAQERAALAGSGLPDAAVERVAFDDLSGWLERTRPDAVILGARGPLVRLVARLVAALPERPVIVTGLPGISLPARRRALVYRAQCDLFILHSQREIDAFGELAERAGMPQRFALTRLPFAVDEIGKPSASGTDLVFAAQAIVPRERTDRLRIARLLIEAARAQPRRRVVLKLRSAAGERETHHEKHAYPELIDQLGGAPGNLVVSYEPMAQALESAEGMVTVSSTAAVEALARGIPVIALDAFGVSDRLLNGVFVGSGLFAGFDEVIARRFRHPDPAWLRENYFHPAVFDDWMVGLGALVDERQRGMLPVKPPVRSRGGRLREAWDRKRVLGREDSSLAGHVALLIGVPARWALISARRVHRALSQQPGPAGSSMQVASTSAVRTSTTRTS